MKKLDARRPFVKCNTCGQIVFFDASHGDYWCERCRMLACPGPQPMTLTGSRTKPETERTPHEPVAPAR